MLRLVQRKTRPADQPLLTTAASLLNGDNSQPDLPVGYAVGMLVRHPQYGIGRVVNVAGMVRKRIVTVEFESDDRRETFVANQSPLQPVGMG